MKRIILAILLAVFSTPVFSGEIKTKAELRAYLKESLPDGQMPVSEWKTGEEFEGRMSRGFECMGEQSFQSMPLEAGLMVRHNLMQVTVKSTNPHGGFLGIGGPECLYEITNFDTVRLEELGVEINTSSDGKNVTVEIPFSKQDFLGIEEVNFKGEMFLEDDDCDISFVPYFRNYDPSAFVMRFKDEFLKHYRYKNVFNKEAKTDTWCLSEKYDGTYKWDTWNRY